VATELKKGVKTKENSMFREIEFFGLFF